MEKRSELSAIFIESLQDVISHVKSEKPFHERFLQNIVLNAIDPIIGLDLEGNIFFWNKGAEETFNYTKEEMTGKSFAVLVPNDPEYQEELRMLQVETNKHGFVRDFHTRRLTKNGEKLHVSLSRTLLKDERGEVLGSIAILRDLTGMRRLEKQVIHNEKLALLGQIAAGMAHEIGSPLSIISGIVECLLMDRDTNHPEREDLETILQQTERIANLVRNLLSFARPKPLQKAAIDIVHEVEKAAALLHGRFEKNCIRLAVKKSANIPKIYADAHQIHQVFLNLFVNACDAMAEQTSDRQNALTITVRVENQHAVHKSCLCVRVADTGPGIHSDIVSKIFEPFITTKEVGKGTGLGLAVSRRIIEEHGGSIDIEDSSNRGTTFVISFPLHGTFKSQCSDQSG